MKERKQAKTKEHKNAAARTRKPASKQRVRFVVDHNYYQTALYAIIAAVFIFFVTFRAINISIERQLNVQVPKKETAPAVTEQVSREEVSGAPQKQIEPEGSLDLVTSDPSQYNIEDQEQNILFGNERRWTSSMKRSVRESDVIDRMSQTGAFEGIKKTPEQFEEQLKRIEGRIREYEQKVQEDPGDDYARQKLQGLYMLKATVKGLKNAVVDK